MFTNKAVPRHRGIALVSAFTIFTGSLAGAAGLAIGTTAPAEAAIISQEGIVGYDIEGVPMPGTEIYVLATDKNNTNYYPDQFDYYKSLGESDEDAEVHAIYAAQQKILTEAKEVASGLLSSMSAFGISIVLAGDDISFYGAMAFGLVENPTYTWSPDVSTPKYQAPPPGYDEPMFGFTWGNNNVQSNNSMYNYWDDNGVWRLATPEHPVLCAYEMGYPELVLIRGTNEEDYTKMKGLSCQGPMSFSVEYIDAVASPSALSDHGPFSEFILGLNSTVKRNYPDYELVDGTRAADAGINGGSVNALVAVAGNPRDGAYVTNNAQFAVLDPQLQVKKEICSTGTNCDVNSDHGWVLDSTYGDRDGATGLDSGVTTGVEQGVVPNTVGDTLQWRLTAVNTGNVALFDTHVAVDLVTAESDDPNVPAPKLVENTCLDAPFLHETSLSPNLLTPYEQTTQHTDNTAVLSCTTRFDTDLDEWSGTIQNTVALNATMPAGWALYADAEPPYNVDYDTPGVRIGIAPLIDPPTRSLADGSWYYDNGTPDDPSDDVLATMPNGFPMDIRYSFVPFIDPNGDDLENRFYGYSQQTTVNSDNSITTVSGPAVQGFVPSNIDSSQVRIAHPGLKVAKWVCTKPEGCATPTAAADLATLGGYNPTDATLVTSQTLPDSGWAKAATVDYDGTAQWLVVLTNTGDVHLNDLALTDQASSTAITDADGQVVVTTNDLSSQLAQALATYPNNVLPPGESVVVTLSTDHITATGQAGQLSPDPTAVDAWQERLYIDENSTLVAESPGTDLINSVSATGTPVREDGTPIGEGNQQMGSITSNTSQAEARAVQPEPGLKVTKWVCPSPKACAVPDDLSAMVGLGADGTVTTGTAPTGSDWVKAATNPTYNTAAKWLIVAANTGDTYLKITPDDLMIGGAGHGPVPPVLTPSTMVLAPGEVGHFTGTTTNITNTQALATTYQEAIDESHEYPLDQSGQAVVNQIELSGAPVTDATGDHPLPEPNTVVQLDNNGNPVDPWDDITSNRSYAEINTVTPNPALKVTKWVCNPASPLATNGVCQQDLTPADLATLSGVAGGSGSPVTVTTGQGLGGWEKQANVDYNTKADWLVVVANIGNVDMSDVTLNDPGATGNGHGMTSPLEFPVVDTLIPGQAHAYQVITTQSITSSGTTDPTDGGDTDNIYVEPEYAVGARTIVNAATATGVPTDQDGNPLPQANTNTNAEGTYETPYDPNDPVVSNQSSAEVSSTVPQPELGLAKWVCDPSFNQGDGCLPVDQLDEVMEILRDPDSGGAGGWVKAATVKYGADAKWLVVVTNLDQDLAITNVTILKEVVENDDDSTAPADCAEASKPNQPGWIEPQASIVFTCTTPTIFNDKDTDPNVVNTAQVTANPVDPNDPDHGPYPAPDGGTGPVVLTSNEDSAEVNTVLPNPQIHLEKWICGQATCTTSEQDQARLAVGQPSGGWVKEYEQPYETTARWLLVVKNTGNVALKDVEVLTDSFDAGAAPTGCATGSKFAPAKLVPGQIGLLQCTTSNIINLNWKTNVAQAQGSPVDDDDQPIPTPDGSTYEPVPSNPSEAKVKTTVPPASLALAKWVCATGTGCPAFTTLAREGQAILANPSSAPGPTDTLTGGWVQRTKVAYGTAADWLIVATNTGQIRLSEVKLSQEFFTPDLPVPAACAPGTLFTPSQLAVAASGVITCTVSSITSTQGLTNTARATGVPPGGDSEEPPPPIPSDPDTSIVETDYPEPNLALTKWVCSKGTGCPAFADLPASGQAVLLNPDNRPAASNEATGGWVKAAWVEYGTAADWLILVTNNGEALLENVRLELETVANGSANAPTCPTRVFAALLASNASAGLICTTNNVTNEQAWGSGKDVINTAQAIGRPVLRAGVRLPLPDAQVGYVDDQLSNQDQAEVRTDTPQPNIEIIKYDVLNGDNATTGHRPEATNPKQLVAEQPTPMRFDITNNGTHELIDVKVTDTTTSGSGVVTSLSCDFSPLGGPATGTTWAGPFLVGDSFTCTGLLEGLAPGQTHQDTATVTGTLELTGQTVTDSDKWHGKVPKVPVVTGGTVITQSGNAPLVLVAIIAIALASAVAMTTRRRTR